jgi:hypothetical protein
MRPMQDRTATMSAPPIDDLAGVVSEHTALLAQVLARLSAIEV